jgi:hypothetical protein
MKLPKRRSKPKKGPRKELIEKALANCRKAEAEIFRLDCDQLFVAKEFGDWILLLMTIHDLANNRQITAFLNSDAIYDWEQLYRPRRRSKPKKRTRKDK